MVMMTVGIMAVVNAFCRAGDSIAWSGAPREGTIAVLDQIRS